jgi:hypothetical protein
MYPHLANGQDGSLGERGLDTARALQQSGVAKPAVSLFGDERSSARGPNPGDPGSSSGRNEPAFDPAKLQGYEGVDPAILRDLTRIGVSQRQGTELRPIYERAVKDDLQRYARSLEANADRLARELPAEGVEAARAMIHDDSMTPPELRPWLLQWSAHPALARLLVNWASAASRGRY